MPRNSEEHNERMTDIIKYMGYHEREQFLDISYLLDYIKELEDEVKNLEESRNDIMNAGRMKIRELETKINRETKK
jgi:hypothetical protein